MMRMVISGKELMVGGGVCFLCILRWMAVLPSACACAMLRADDSWCIIFGGCACLESCALAGTVYVGVCTHKVGLSVRLGRAVADRFHHYYHRGTGF